MDHKFTQDLGVWLQTDSTRRDLKNGAMMFLKLSGNKIMYHNIISKPEKYKDFLEFQLQKYYNFRVQALTHEQVCLMEEEVRKIAEDHIQPKIQKNRSKNKKDEKMENTGPVNIGKRDDHDKLPDEIKAKFIENLSILQQMRELHLQLRQLSLENVTCPDSERYPFLKELIDLDIKLHKNWEEYDKYVITKNPEAQPAKLRKSAVKPTATKKTAASTKRTSKKIASA